MKESNEACIVCQVFSWNLALPKYLWNSAVRFLNCSHFFTESVQSCLKDVVSINYVKCAFLHMDNKTRGRTLVVWGKNRMHVEGRFWKAWEKQHHIKSEKPEKEKINVKRDISLARNPFKLPCAYLLYC